MKNLFLIVFSLLAISCSDSTKAESIYYNGTILTMNDNMPEAKALAVTKGKILAVGSLDELYIYTNKQTKFIDLSNKTLLPGFVDPHSHVFGIAIQSVAANLYPAPDGSVNNIDDLLSELKKYYATNPDLYKEIGFVVGFGYDDSQLKEQRHPNKFDLDKAFPDIPVYIMHQSGHMGVANSKALEFLAIDSNSQDPVGGIIQRVEGSREPNGVLDETIHISSFYRIAKFSPIFAAKMFLRGVDLMTTFGYTTVQEGRSSEEQVLAMKVLGLLRLLPIDVVSYPDIFMAPKSVLSASHKYTGRFRVGGMKISLDGSPQGKTAWRDRPYVVPPHGHGPEYVGYPAIERSVVFEKIELAYASNIQVLAHANGEAAIDLFIDAVENAEKKYGNNDQRPVLIHGQFTRKDQVNKIKKLGIFPSLFPLHTYYWGDWHREQTIGRPGYKDISPTKWFEDAGMMFTSHHDAPIAVPNNIRVLWATVNRISRTGKEIGPEQRVSVMTGLKSLTLWSAFQHFEEDTKGSFEVGKLADMIILSDNPLTVDPMDIAEIEVLSTIKEGKVVFTKK